MSLPDLGEIIAEKYRLDALIGKGGFAVVYRAVDLSVGRSVAVKLLKPGEDGNDLTLAARFTREARLLSGLSDEHTVRLFDFGTENGVMFMVFEYLEGDDLADRIERDGPLSSQEAKKVLRQVLLSLREAHDASLLHRDIKPANLFVYRHLDDPLRVKLIDFGIARSTEPDAVSVTQTGAVIGTPRYMAPEQLCGDALPQSDLYSLGLVICEAVGADLKTVRESLAAGRPLDLPRLPSRLNHVLTGMLQGDPNRRYPSAAEVLAALDAELPSQPVAAARAGSTSGRVPAGGSAASMAPRTDRPSPSLTTRSASNRSVALTAGVAAVFVVGGLVVWFTMSANDDGGQLARSEVLRQVAQTDEPPPAAGLVRTADVEPRSVDVGRAKEDLAAADVPADGCAADRRPGEMHDRLAGQTWVTYTPTSYQRGDRHPLLLAFHADGSDARKFLTKTGLRRLADEHGVVVAAWESPGMGAWRDGIAPGNVATVVDELRSSACIDSERIFVLGHGSGGGAAEALSCEPWVRAVATTAYRLVKGPICRGAPKPLLHIAPMKTKNMPVEGGEACGGFSRVMSLADHEQVWRERNRCRGKRRVSLRDGRTVCYTWDCEESFISCHVDGGHGWPGEGPRWVDVLGCDGPRPTFDYLGTIWRFLQDEADNPRAADGGEQSN